MKISLSLHKIYYFRASVCCMYTWLPVAVPFLASWCFRLCEDPKQCSSILIWVLLGFDMLVLLLFVFTNENIAIPTHNILHQSQSMTRSSRKDSYRQIQCNKNSYKFSFFCQTIKDWNKLSPDINVVCCMYTWLPIAVPFLASWCFRLWGSQTRQQYSNLGLIRVWYARSFIVCDCTFRFLLISNNIKIRHN
jgi:hypothetical protein